MPDDSIGWTDESFSRAVAFVRNTMNHKMTWLMSEWLVQQEAKHSPYLNRIGHNMYWSVFKRPMLVPFFNYPPSTMALAYQVVKSGEFDGSWPDHKER